MIAPDVGAHAPKRRRGLATRQRVLQVATQAIDEHGEAALRVEDVAQAAGVSVGTIYRYFGNREGLVVAVRAAQFLGALDEDLDQMERLIRSVSTPAEFVESLQRLTRAAGHPSRAPLRMQRIEIIGASRARPALARAIGEEQARITDRFAAILRRGQERGLIDPSLDPRSLAQFVLAFTLGQVLAEIDTSTPFDLDGWTTVAERFAAAVAARPEAG
ncbi:TetR/AcrR family transcriptional regulator [Rhabdothermincola sp.]|uniref:TetR/AcrR family transcriptional regulator n=1 Tax=Rhabdothermincola sp. TaxID=2820405 RepID=UPI002FE26F5A